MRYIDGYSEGYNPQFTIIFDDYTCQRYFDIEAKDIEDVLNKKHQFDNFFCMRDEDNSVIIGAPDVNKFMMMLQYLADTYSYAGVGVRQFYEAINLERKYIARLDFINENKNFNNMNKTALYNKIMHGIEKSLNEGFSSWKDEHKPKFNNDLYKEKIVPIINVLQKLFADKEITRVAFVIKFEDKNVTMLNIDNAADLASYNAVVSGLFNKVENTFKDKYAEVMNNLTLCVIVGDHYFNEYVSSEINVANPKYAKSCEYIRIGKNDSNYFLYLDSKNVLEHGDEILEWLS